MEIFEMNERDRVIQNYRNQREKRFKETHEQENPNDGYKPLVFSVLLFLVVLWLIVKFSG